MGIFYWVKRWLGWSPHVSKCTKEMPWDGHTIPVEHVGADFFDDTNWLKCPNCGHVWSIGPDI